MEEPGVKGGVGGPRPGLRSIYKISDKTLLLFHTIGRTAYYHHEVKLNLRLIFLYESVLKR
jgi:hypothetical protein